MAKYKFSDIITMIFSFLSAVIVFLYSTLMIFLLWWLLLIPKHKRYSVAHIFLITPWCLSFFFLYLIRIKVIGKEYIDKKRTTLYICNHQSWVDVPILLMNNNATVLAKEEVHKIPFIGLLIRYAGTLTFKRDEKNSRMGIVKEVITLFRGGHSFCICPEGSRTNKGELLTPSLALIKLCYKLNIPVVSSAISGTYDMLPRGRYYLGFFKKIILKYTPPTYPKDFDNEEDFANACWSKVVNTYNELTDNRFLNSGELKVENLN
jgi:1-acyl-sn-glycerol-3-phosphate acyltransferase